MMRETVAMSQRHRTRHGGLAMLALVCFSGMLIARTQSLPHRLAAFPPAVSSATDSLADIELGVDLPAVYVAGETSLRAPYEALIPERTRAALDAPRSIRRGNISRIALPPPAGA